MRSFKIYFWLRVFIVLVLVIGGSWLYIQDKIQRKSFERLGRNEGFGNSKSCVPSKLDPWDPSIRSFSNPFSNPLKNCVPTVKMYTDLVEGQLILFNTLPKGATCRYRCLSNDGDMKIVFGKWKKLVTGVRPKCDVIEVECDYGDVSHPFYRYVHIQAYRSEVPSSTRESPEKFDVHMIVFDSTSHSNFIRTMSKTLQLMTDLFEAIPFPNLNKVGLNTFPNSYALLFGKTAYSIPKSPFSRGYPSDYGDGTSDYAACGTYRDKDQYLPFRFQDDGYVTMSTDDWGRNFANWPKCRGFKNSPVNHYLKPYELCVGRFNNYGDGDQCNGMKDFVFEGSCRETYQNQMEYMKSFITTYPDKPKFSLLWNNDLGHENINGLYHVDEYFYQYFKDFKDYFDNSFLILMGDHGFRMGGIRNTQIGEAEDNNPAFFMSIPKALRGNETLMETLRNNSKLIFTHYDTYATLTEIVNPSKSRVPNPLIHGSSLFHPLPYPRDCDSLRIPYEYCLCKGDISEGPKNSDFAKALAESAVTHINSIIHNSSELKPCVQQLTLGDSDLIDIKEYEPEKNSTVKVYQIEFSTVPGNAQFQGFVSRDLDGTVNIISPLFTRLDSYHDQALCAIHSLYAAYCYCKNLIE